MKRKSFKKSEPFAVNFNEEAFVRTTINDGGCSVNPLTGVYPEGRFYVATVTKRIPIDEFSELSVVTFILNNWETFTKTGWHIGTYVVKDIVFLELVYNTDNFYNAIETGISLKQLSIWDSTEGLEIPVPSITVKNCLTDTQYIKTLVDLKKTVIGLKNQKYKYNQNDLKFNPYK